MDLTATQALEKCKTILDDVVDNIINNGYYRAPNYSNWGMSWRDIIIPEVTLRKFARRVAKENKRPFIQVWTQWKYVQGDDGFYTHVPNGIGIEIPKRKYTAPLIHPLEMAGFEKYHYQSLWQYRIEDMTFAEEYLSYFKTREEFRQALRLPPL